MNLHSWLLTVFRVVHTPMHRGVHTAEQFEAGGAGPSVARMESSRGRPFAGSSAEAVPFQVGPGEL